MKTFDQEVLSDHGKGIYGDCMRACVYTLIGENAGLPHPIDSKNGLWNFKFFSEIERRGRDLVYQPKRKDHWTGLVIACGPGPRGHRHAVVWNIDHNVMFHDPHPSRSGLLGIDGWYILK